MSDQPDTLVIVRNAVRSALDAHHETATEFCACRAWTPEEQEVHAIRERWELNSHQAHEVAVAVLMALRAVVKEQEVASETRVEYVLRWTRPDTGEPWETVISPPKDSSPEAALAFAVTRRDQLQEFATQQGWGENFYILHTRTVTTTAWQEIHDV